MNAYLDSSVVLRIAFHEPNPLKEFRQIQRGVSSELLRIECLRTADRYRLVNGLTDGEYVSRIELLNEFMDHVELVRMVEPILTRASQPFPISLGTLDAIHLATCLIAKERTFKDLVLCTHDASLKRAGISLGFKVLG